MFLRDLAGPRAVALVIRLELLEAGDDVVRGGEGEQPRAGRQPSAEAGVLGQHRTAARQVAGAAIAEPTGPGHDVAELGEPELRPRSLHEAPVVIRGCRDLC